MTTQFSLIIPTFNEAENIAILLPRVMEILDPLVSYELIVVDDDSRDNTWQIVETMAQSRPQIRLIRRINAKGLSSAIRDGFKAAGGMALGVMDADLQHDASVLPSLIAGLNKSPIVIASRYLETSNIGSRSGERELISRCAIWMAQRILKLRVSDPVSGYFVMRREVFDQIAHQMNPRGFKILMEILYRSKIKDVLEIPYAFGVRTNGVSKLHLGVGWDYLISICDLLSNKGARPHP